MSGAKPIIHLWKPLLALAVGVLAISTGAIFVRLAQDAGAPSLVVAAGRLSVATLILTPITIHLYKHELRALRPGEIGLALLSGGVLSLHFATWISSLEYTSVVNSIVLVSTTPLWVALFALLLLGEKLTRRVIFGLMLAFGGGLLVSLAGGTGDPPTRADPLLGNGLAIAGALMAASYMTIGRRLRLHMSVIPYIWLVYSTAAVIMLAVMVVSGNGRKVPDLSGEVFLWLLLLGLIPQLLGHSAFNYALGFLPVAYVSIVGLGEPIGGGALAAVFLGEWPVGLQILGSALILTGIGVATREQFSQKTTASPGD
jgi:drug/metabolite transporter (DMT)-like permease